MVPYDKTCYSYKIVVVICLYQEVQSLLSLFFINGMYSWFTKGKEFLMAHTIQDGITFSTPFPNHLWIHQVCCL